MAATTACLVAADTPALPFSTRLTVASLTPACVAISLRRAVTPDDSRRATSFLPPQHRVRRQHDLTVQPVVRRRQQHGTGIRQPHHGLAHVGEAVETAAAEVQ